MSKRMERRHFLELSGTAGLAAVIWPNLLSANEIKKDELRIGVIGVGLRGTWHLSNLIRRKDVEVPAICDIDPERIDINQDNLKKAGRKNVGATFNLCHYLMTDNEKYLESLIKSAVPYLFVVTINGANTEAKDWKGLIQTLNKGDFDLKQFLGILDDAGYSGPIGLQGYGIKGEAYENLKRSMSAWCQINKQQTVQ